MSIWFRQYGFADVLDDFLVGAYPVDPADVAMLKTLGVERILNLAEETEYRPGDRDAVEAALDAAGIVERRLPLPDYGGLPPAIIDRAVREILAWLEEGKRSYLHCRAGWQRSAVIAAGVVAVRERLDIDDALASVQLRRPSADPLPHQREDLKRWWDERKTTRATQPREADGR